MALIRVDLNPAQRNAIAIALRETEIALRRLLADLDADEHGRLYARVTIVGEAQRRQIERLVNQALDEIVELADALDLPPQSQNPLAERVGQMTVLWSDLIDSRADKLARYGEVDPAAPAVLNPPLDRLIALLEKLMGVASRRGPA